MARARKQGMVIVGAGPGGLAPLFAAASRGDLQELLDAGVTILERGFEVGAGTLGQYAITSDSAAAAILDIVTQSREPSLAALRSHPTVTTLAGFGNGAVPLALVGQFLKLAGEVLCQRVAASAKGQVVLGAQAHWTQQTEQGLWRTCFMDAVGRAHTVLSNSVVLATGAHQPVRRLHTEQVAGAPLLPKYQARLLQSSQVLTPAGLIEVERRLAGKPSPRVAIVGGSTSAATVALALLTRLPGTRFQAAGIALLHRRPLRIFYESTEEALRDGYTDFTAGDICALTGRLYRLGGFRLDSRELMQRVLGVAGRPAEPRIRVFDLSRESDADATSLLEQADLVIAAMGYRPRLLPVLDNGMRPVPLLVPDETRWAVVDQRCRVITAEGAPLQGLFAMGLAVGPAASRELGGELDFRGQVNSLWLWQHTLGGRVATQLAERARRHVAPQHHPDVITAAAPHPAAQGSGFDHLIKMAGAA